MAISINELCCNLSLGTDGIWYGDPVDGISYPADGNEVYRDIEEHSFWFRQRTACIVAAVRRYPPPGGGGVFDIGGGNGYVAAGLAEAGFDVALVEPGLQGCRNAVARGVRNVVCATIDSARFKHGALPAAGLFDVVEHVADDHAILHSLHSIVQEGGRIYLTVPTYSWLWSDADVTDGHYRRYSRRRIESVVEQAGFRIDFSTYFFRLLPLGILGLRTIPFRLGLGSMRRQSHPVHDHQERSRLAASILDCAHESEVRNIQRGRAMSFGSSCLIVASK